MGSSKIKDTNNKYKIELNEYEERITRHKPSVNILYRSVNNCAGSGAMGIILTGRGDDGYICLKEMSDNNARIIIQSEESSFCFGMPGSAIKNGVNGKNVDLKDIVSEIVKYSEED